MSIDPRFVFRLGELTRENYERELNQRVKPSFKLRFAPTSEPWVQRPGLSRKTLAKINAKLALPKLPPEEGP